MKPVGNLRMVMRETISLETIREGFSEKVTCELKPKWNSQYSFFRENIPTSGESTYNEASQAGRNMVGRGMSKESGGRSGRLVWMGGKGWLQRGLWNRRANLNLILNIKGSWWRNLRGVTQDWIVGFPCGLDAMQETQIWSLDQEDPLEKKMSIYPSIGLINPGLDYHF